MAVDMFMKIPDIPGESLDAQHSKEIDVLSWSWGMSQSGTAHLGSGQGSGKVSVQDFSFTKYIDASSHALLLACCSGKHISKANFVVRKSAGDKPLEYIKIEFEDLIISTIHTGGNGSEDRLTESIAINFGKFKYAYVPQKKDGSGDAEKTAGWNIAKNEKV